MKVRDRVCSKPKPQFSAIENIDEAASRLKKRPAPRSSAFGLRWIELGGLRNKMIRSYSKSMATLRNAARRGGLDQ
jgi:hypothetical protein